jgi:hypothetical protein
VVDKHRKPSGAKTDFIDARLLADLGRKDYLGLRPLVLADDLLLIVLIEEIALYDKEILSLFKQHKDCEIFKSLPGAGKR